MYDIYIKGFYLIIADLTNGNTKEFQQSATSVQYNEERGIISITGPRTEQQITTDDISVGDWLINGVEVLVISEFLDFLYSNTGNFSSASGGSGAKYRAVLAFDNGTITTLTDNFPIPIASGIVFQGGSYVLDFDGNPIPQNMRGMFWSQGTKYWRSFVRVIEGVFRYEQERSNDGITAWASADYENFEGLETTLVLEYYE